MCSTNRKPNKNKSKETKKKAENSGLLIHFICRVNMILSMFTWVWDHLPWVQVWVREWVLHVMMSRRHGYGSETRSMGTGTICRIWISMGTGMGKGTTSLLSWALYSCNWKIWLQVQLSLSMKEGFMESVFKCYRYSWHTVPNKLVLRKDTDILHLAMGGCQKVF